MWWSEVHPTVKCVQPQQAPQHPTSYYFMWDPYWSCYRNASIGVNFTFRMWRFIWPRSQNYQEDSPVIHLLWRQEPKCLVQFPLYHEITWWKNPCWVRIPTPALPNPSMFRAHLPHHQYAGIKILHWNNKVPALITIFKDGNSQATATSYVSLSPSW